MASAEQIYIQLPHWHLHISTHEFQDQSNKRSSSPISRLFVSMGRFNAKSTGTEVVAAFPSQVEGRTCKYQDLKMLSD